MSWAAHEFENYFIQKHVGVRASFLAIVLGTQMPDLFTKAFVYASDDPAAFHRGWPGVGPTHSLIFGALGFVLVLWVTKSRSWALGILIGQWAHVVTDFADTAGAMPFFPFSTEPVTISMWEHAAAEGRFGDAAAYYSSLGGGWDLAWFLMLMLFAREALTPTYFRSTIVPADPKVWGWLHDKLRLPEAGLLCLYWGFFFYGLGRMTTWFTLARVDARADLDVTWAGPSWGGGLLHHRKVAPDADFGGLARHVDEQRLRRRPGKGLGPLRHRSPGEGAPMTEVHPSRDRAREQPQWLPRLPRPPPRRPTSIQ